MSITLPYTQFPLLTSSLHKRSLPSGQYHRAWKRRRIKLLALHNQLNPSSSPFDNLFQSLITQFSSLHTIDYIAPTLGLVSGLTLFFSSKSQKLLSKPNGTNNFDNDIGEWILFTSPTPFNRFVTLRCPSIYFQGSELLENVNEKLLKEDRHFVRLNSGRMLTEVENDGEVDEKLVYQRVCVNTEDGGVVSLDWPANLDLEEESGLDTTVLIIPGTPEGSNERRIKEFVYDCLKTGLFPVVMNPRGCAGSPLTTARLFTAADSDDISTAIQCINKARPWTTFMAVAWGYGANMLTKYLAEVGENTPLTAATCIDNPFDLEDATRTSMYHIYFDQKLTSGLISILDRNKELFQGRGKGFDVDRALSASSIREFEKEVSMVSYGFDTIEDFYAKSSTRDVVGKVKIPVLFIQNDDETVPLFSIPRSLIAENPYTSLLLCSYSPSRKIMNDRSTFSWCQHLIIEWLTAVELGLLKGRHPLLKDVDVNINPSKGLSLAGGRSFGKSGRIDKLFNRPNTDSIDSRSLNLILETLEGNNITAGIQSQSRQESRGSELDTNRLKQESNGIEHQSSAVNAELIEDGTNPVDNERGQVLQTAGMVMNMLDVTIPGSLSEEQKKKVLNAVGQGETLMKALQDTVPEDVREKLTTAVSGILQSQGSNLSLGHISDVAAGLNSKVLEKIRLSKGGGDDDHSSDQKRINQLGDGSDKVHSSDKSPEVLESEFHSSENSQNSIDMGEFQSTSTHTDEDPGSENVDMDMGNNQENAQLSLGNAGQSSDDGNVRETSDSPEISNQSEGPGSTEDIVADQKKLERESVKNQSDLEENNKQKIDLPTDEHTVGESSPTEDKSSAPSSSSETQLTEKDVDNNQRKEEKGEQPVSSQNTDVPPSFSMSQALDALTGFDDSTQVAVNSVFNVIEDMIDQYEVEKDSENEVKDRNNQGEVNGKGMEVKDLKEGSVSENPHENDDHKLEKMENNKNELSISSGSSDDVHSDDPPDSEGRSKKRITIGGHDSDGSRSSNTKSQFGKEKASSLLYAGRELSSRKFNKYLNDSSQEVPSSLTAYPYSDPLYKEYLKAYLISKMADGMPPYLDTTPALYLDYIPEEGQWKLLDQAEDNGASIGEFTTHQGGSVENRMDINSRHVDVDDIIEPCYVVLDAEKQHEQDEDWRKTNKVDYNIEIDGDKFDESMIFIRSIILESLNVEVNRRIGAADMEELEPKLARDIEHIANAVSLAVLHGKGYDNTLEKSSTLCGENIVQAISSAMQDTEYISRVLPVGVIVGSSLAALRKFFDVAAVDCNGNDDIGLDLVSKTRDNHIQEGDKETNERLSKNIVRNHGLGSSVSEGTTNMGLKNTNNTVMVGAVTAALGASALLVHQQNIESAETSTGSFIEDESSKELSKFEEEIAVKTQNNIVTSFAEKALSVASPVVPTKENGEVDHERLVAMLAELGQKGGILKLVGKVALLWGGIRGAISLTDKLISFLHIGERPLIQRILGFVFLVLLLWSPVVIPLLPSLIQSWATHSPFKIAEFVCIAGLYVSIMIMITLWGKRIRNYDNPLRQYGMDLTSILEFKNFLMGLGGGAMLVLLIQSVNSAIGCVQLCWPATLSLSSSDPVTLLRVYGRMIMLFVQGLATATCVAVAEELLFRSWLPQEIAADLGYHHGIIISGLAFSLFQRSLWEIPGLWLLSISLSGARQRSQGCLSLPIGIRAGILASSFFLKMGGFLNYLPSFPLWFTGGHPFQPFSGIVGLVFSLILAVVFYPRQSVDRTKQQES
ncbi:alpha/beta-hydrolase superfamily protein [Forsythia ovata]|uniref:Alpha/beta-hydrolase superfamily protein n=1 Tax=Forsythia ovata TaxID=205694 RepID=A0ABD1SRM6_9LAMI